MTNAKQPGSDPTPVDAVFSAALGGLPAALRALAGYLVYGATLGGLVGATAPTGREPAPSR